MKWRLEKVHVLKIMYLTKESYLEYIKFNIERQRNHLGNGQKTWRDITLKKKSTQIYRDANKHMKLCSTSWAIREMKIKITIRCHYIPTRTAKIKNSDDTKFCKVCRETGFLICCWWECMIVQLLWKTFWWFL